MLELNRLYNMDCMEGMKMIDDNSIDAIVTDPPYELGFMGKKWDNTGIAYNVDLWREALRVLKHGGQLLAFGGTRTYHRMACAIEDAGFEIRDCIQWLYGSGFPKSLNVKKKIEGEYQCRFIENVKLVGMKLKHIPVELQGERIGFVLVPVEIKQEENAELIMAIGKEEDLKGQTDMCLLESTEKINSNTMLFLKRKLEEKLQDKNNAITLMELKTIIDLKIWKLFQYQNTLNTIITMNHTALKPANEPIVLARKPLSEKSVAENVLKWGTGGINIDGCRVGIEERTYKGMSAKQPDVGTFRDDNWQPKDIEVTVTGRFPANVIHDGSDEVLNGLGSAARFFYCAKASKTERNMGCEELEEKYQDENRKIGSAGGCNPRNRGAEKPIKNFHPTVKPLSLMKYLITLITPPKGTVLDMFAGSGTTCMACTELGFNWIAFEREYEYCVIANERIRKVTECLERVKAQMTMFDESEG